MTVNRRSSGANFSKKCDDRDKKSYQGKKQLPAPIHVGHFILIILMKLCKKILLADTAVKIGIYLMIVLIGSVVADLVQLPRMYLSEKHNVLNLYFVKLGWGWTSLALLSFTAMTCYVYCCGQWNKMKIHFFRLGLATFWWYLITAVINLIESQLGICSEPKHPTRFVCEKSGKSWLGFDISGHVFLLIHCLLTISEELKMFRDWPKLENILNSDSAAEDKNMKREHVAVAQDALRNLNPYIKINFMFLAVLYLLWECMLIISTIYRFHTLSQKVAAAFISVGCWFISYRLILRSKNGTFPLSGQSSFHFTKLDK